MGGLREAVQNLGDLVAFPTITSKPNLGLIEYLVDRLEPLGADIRLTHDESGSKANLFATIGPRIDGGVVVSGHSDVVRADEPDWANPPFTAVEKDDRIFGRGTTDMKGFIACAVATAGDFAAAPLQKPLHIAVTYDEEVGCRGAPVLLADLAAAGIKPAAAVIGEPTEMSVVTAHKGMHEYTTTISGLESHASMPVNGVNAIHYGVRYVSRLLELAATLEGRSPATSRYDPPHSTMSVGTINGGMARNVVAGECVIEWELRPIDQSDARWVMDEVIALETSLLEEMRLIASNASITTVTEGAVSGLARDENSYAVRLLTDLVGGPTLEVASFGTEAGLYQAAGIPAVVCGPGDIEMAHRPNEYVGLDQLTSCLDFLERLEAKLCEDPGPGLGGELHAEKGDQI